MSSFTCPFCSITMPITPDTRVVRYPSFRQITGHMFIGDKYVTDDSCVAITFYKCPQCCNFSIFASATGAYTKGLNIPLIPRSLAKHFPEYIPKPIREDYEEAYSILNLSPKASATLSRRCLQGMIRDFWGINKSNLAESISCLQDKVSPAQWKAIDAIRSIGNIGAHMEKDINVIIDVEPDEAQKLLKLIELLIEKWYIARHDEEQLLSDITAISDSKRVQKHSSSTQ